jgi:hypothetical protein
MSTPESGMPALILTLVCGLAALPVAAQEFAVSISFQTAEDQQPGSVSFDINSNSGTQVYNPDGSFSFTNVAISNFMSNVNGTPFLSAPAATGLWAKDVSPFGGFQITGAGGALFNVETDIVSPVTIDPSDPLFSFLSQGIFPASSGSLGTPGQLNFMSETVTVTPVATSVPEPAGIPLLALAGLLLTISRRRDTRAALARRS